MDPLKLFDEAKEQLLRTEARRAKATSADKTNELPDGEARSLGRFGSVSMPTERKVMVALAGFCIATCCAAILSAAFYMHIVLGLLTLAILSWWIGSSIAEVLKTTKDDSSPNIGGVARGGDQHSNQSTT